MKSKNKFMIIFLSFIMLSLMILPNLKADLDKESVDSANILAKQGIIVDNSTSPEKYNLSSTITRREMLKVMMNLSGREVQDTCQQKFADLPSSDWGCKYAETALSLGYIAPNKTFRPNDPVSKAESLKMIFQAKNIEAFKTEDWRVGYIRKAVELGYTENFTDYNTASKRSFVFLVGSKTILGNSIVKEEIISYDKPRLLVNFEESMNKTSVLSNLKVYPEVNFTSNWVDDKNLELVINDIISRETDILVNVFEKALTTSGNNLDKTISKTFKVDGEAIIEFVTPSGLIGDLNQNITVRFSKPIVSLTNLDNQAKCPIEITPNIPGKCVWITTSTFQFRPTSGFPTGGKYQVNVPSGITTISGDTTKNSKSFEITTPDFLLVSDIETLNLDEKLKFAFNDEVSIENFKNNFSISSFTNDRLNFIYYKGENDLEESRNIISVYPKTGNWGYNKSYIYNISKNLTSSRGNVGLKSNISKTMKTNDFLLSYSPVVLFDTNAEEKYLISNFRQSQNNKIITKNNPSVLLQFYKEIELDKNIFSSSLPFEINYVKTYNYDNGNEELIIDKKQILISFTGNIQNNFVLNINPPRVSGEDLGVRTLNFQTKSENNIVQYKQINYKKACLTVKNDLGDIQQSFKSFEFNQYGKVDYIYKINNYTKDDDCKFESGKNKYVVVTRLNPSSDYTLIIRKTFLDSDNYPLDKDYNFSFKTPAALNEDKQVSIIDGRQLILIPNDITPISIGLQSTNLSQAQIKVCSGDLDILSKNYLKGEECITKTISLNNLGFKPNLSVIDLEKIFGKQITKKYVWVEVSKLSSDKTDYEAKNDYYISKTSFIISDIAATIKSAKNNLLWLHNYSSGVSLSDSISKIESYKKEAEYGIFGSYEGQKVTFEKEISFTPKENGIYELSQSNFTTLLITLKNGEQVILDDVYNYYHQNEEIYNYISTDRPIYKAGDKVEIAGISRLLQAKGYTINTKSVQINVVDSQYKNILSKSVTPNSLGAFDTSFELKQDANLGNYTINVGGNSLIFSVEEYEKPDFKVTTKSQKDNYLYGEIAKVDIESEYYIGLPLSNGEGNYSLYSNDFYFDGGKTTGYTFGEQKDFWWGIRPMYERLGGVYYGGNNFEKTGNFVLNNDGKTTFQIPLESSSKDKIYTVSTTVTDPNTKKSISTNTNFKAIRSKIFLGIKFDKYFYAYKDTAQIGMVSVDIEGNKLANQNFDYKVYKVDYVYDENTFRYNTKEKLVLEKSLFSNNSGLANESFVFDEYGEYRFEIVTGEYKTSKTIYVSGGDILRPVEAQNNIEVLSDKDNYNIGEKAKIAISSPVIGVKAFVTIEKLNEVLNYSVIDIDNFSEEVEIDIKKEYLPNFNFGVYIIKDVKSSSESLEKLKDLRIQMNEIEQELQKEDSGDYIPYITFDLSIWPIPQQEDFDIDLLSKLASLRLEERELLNKIIPSYYIGTKELKVNLDTIKLNSNIKLDKISYLPGDKQTIELSITDNLGNLINGETTISIIDESLLALKENKTDIIDYFYSGKVSQIQTLGNLTNLIKRLEFSLEDNSETLQSDNRVMSKSLNGLGGAVMEEAAPMADMDDSFMAFDSGEGESQTPNETRLRTEFKDLAFYKTKVKVENGKAILQIPALPDNLTTWVISGFAYTSDSKVGNYENKFKVQKDLALLPQIPRFFLTNDNAQISALVVNNTSTSKEVQVKLDMTNITLTGTLEKTISVGANLSVLVTFPILILNPSPEGEGLSNLPLLQERAGVRTEISLKATSGNLADSLQVSKPIYPSKTAEYVFTNGSTTDLSYEEKVDFSKVSQNGGYLEISVGATILTNLTKNLDKVVNFPGDDLNSKLIFLENALVLEELYKKIEKTSDFESIILEDFNGKSYKIKEVMDLVKNDIKNYVQNDNGLSYFKDCSKWFFQESCSDMYVTGKFLNLNIIVSGVDNKKLLEYYKKELFKKIEENKKYNIETTSIIDFLPIALFKDSEFVNKYFKPEENLTNEEKLNYIKLYNLLGVNQEKSNTYLLDLKNSILIEARGSVLPAEKSYSPLDNSVSTAKMISILIEKGTSEKLLTENLVRFLLSNRDEEGNYYTESFSEIIKSIIKYIDFTKELEDVSFEAKAYLNSQEIMTSSFGESNKFSIDKKIFDFETYLKVGENLLGFEKTGNGKLYYDVGVRYYLPVSEMAGREEGITVSRSYYNYDEYKEAFKKECITPWWFYDFPGYCITKKIKNIDSITSANKGDFIVGEIEILLDRERTNLVVNDFLPAGAEILNTNFNTTSIDVKDISGQNNNFWQGGFDFVEQKNDRIYLYAKHLSAGSYKYTYVLKANHIGNYNLKPAIAELLEKPEIWGRSSGGKFEVR